MEKENDINLERLVEQLQPQSFRTFRSEFHMSSASEHTSTYTTTTHYSKQYIQKKSSKTENGTTIKISDEKQTQYVDETDKISNGRPPDKHTTLTQIIQEAPNTYGTSMQFSEIKSLKRVHKVHESIGTDSIIDAIGVTNPYTGERMTVRDAISERILDVRSEKIIVSPNGAQMTVDEAKENGFIDAKVAEKLQSPCGVREDGRELTLLEAIQRRLLDAENAYLDPSEKRQKVTHSMTINQAIDDGKVDVTSGTYRLESGEIIDIKEAYKRGYLLQHTEVKLQMGALALTDVITQGLIDDVTGWIVDRNSGNKYQIDAAVKCNIVDGDLREIVDPKTDSKITVIQALDKGIINPKLGKYVLGHEKLSLLEAKRRQLVVKPKTLKELVDDNLIDDAGKILSPLHQTRLTILEAADRAVIDVSQIKSILDHRTNELITFSEALQRGIILPDSTFKNSVTGESLTIPEAVNRGYIISVVKKSIFDVDGFQPPDKSDYISFNAAAAKGFVSNKNNGSLLVNTKSGKLVPFVDGVQSGEVKPEIYEMLTRKIGIYENHRELDVLEAVFKGYIDAKTGNLIDIKTGKVVFLNEAIAQHLITPEGAATLNSLLNLHVSTKVTRTLVQRYATVTSKDITHEVITYTEALRLGLINNELQTFVDPKTKEVIPIVQAISEGRLAPDVENSEKIISPRKSQSTVITITSKKETPLAKDKYRTEHRTSSTSEFLINEKQSSERQVYELPSEGWPLSSAIAQKLIDPVTGLFIIPGTDRLASFEECISLKLINPNSITILDPISKRKITVQKALDKKIIDSTGHYIIDNERLTLIEAIERGYILLEETMQEDDSAQRFLQITRTHGQPAKVEVSSVVSEHPPVFTEVKVSEASSSTPIQIKTGAIYDPVSNTVTDPNGKGTVDLITAVLDNRIPPESVKITDPVTGKSLDIKEAIQKNIFDPTKGEYTDNMGIKITLTDAAKFGLLTVVGAPIVATQSIIKSIKTFYVKNPKTGARIPGDVALKEGLIDLATYEKMQGELEACLATMPQSVATLKITDSKTGQCYSPEEALARGLVTLEQLKELSEQAQQTTTTTTTLTITDSKTGRKYTPDEAVNRGLITPEQLKEMTESSTVTKTTLKISDPKTGQLYSPEQAVSQGFITKEQLKQLEGTTQQSTVITTLKITDPKTGQTYTPQEALNLGLITVAQLKEMEEQSKQSAITTTNVKITDSVSGQTYSAEEALQKGLITPEQLHELEKQAKSTAIEITDPKTGESYSPAKALELGLITPDQLRELENSGEITSTIRISTVPVTSEKVKTTTTLTTTTTIKITDPKTGVTYTAQEALDRGLITAEQLKQLEENNKTEKSTSTISTLQFTDPKTGKTYTTQEALEKGLLTIQQLKELEEHGELKSTLTVITTKITDPRTGQVYTPQEAYKIGLITIEQLKEYEDGEKQTTSTVTSQVVTDSQEALQKGIITEQQLKELNSKTKNITSVRTLTTETISLDQSEGPSEAEKTRARITIEPTYTVKIGRATSLSPDRDAKRTVLHKLRKRVVRTKDAVETGLLDPKTASILENKDNFINEIGEPITLEEAVETNKVNGKDGVIIDPQRGDKLTISEAIERGILDSDSDLANQLLVPLNRSLSIPELIKQGLIDPKTQKVVHPETGVHLSISEAITCDIIDPFSTLLVKTGDKVTLTEALEKGVVDDETSLVDTTTGVKKLEDAVKDKVFDDTVPSGPLDLPPAGMTLEVAVRRGLVDPNKKEIIHPVTKETIPLTEAIKENLIMSLPFPPKADAVKIEEALEGNLIDTQSATFKNPQTGELYPLSEAVEKGMLIVKEPGDLALDISAPITTVTGFADTVHTVTTVTIELLSGYALINNNEVQNIETGQIMSLEEAKKRGIVKDISQTKNKTIIKGTQMSFSDALQKGLVDMNSGTFTDPKSGEKITIQKALQDGIILSTPKITSEETQASTVTTTTTTTTTSSSATQKTTELNIHEAFDTIYNEKTEKFVDVSAGNREITFKEALEKEIIDPNSMVYDVASQKPVTIEQAVDQGLIDSKTGKIKDEATGKSIDFKEATKKGLIAVLGGLALPVVAPVVAGVAAVQAVKDYANKKKQEPKVFEPTQQKTSTVHILKKEETVSTVDVVQILPIGDAIAQNLIEPKICRIVYQKKELPYTVQDGLDQDKISPLDVIQIVTNHRVILVEIHKSPIITITKQMTAEKLAELGYFDRKRGLFVDPQTGNHISFEELIYELGVIDPDTVLVKNLTKKTPTYITLHEALEKPLLDRQTGYMVDPKTGKRVPFFEAIKLRWIIHVDDKPKEKFKPITLQEISDTDKFDPNKVEVKVGDSSVALIKALNTNVVDPKSVTIRDPKNMQLVPYFEAVDKQVVDPQRGLIVNTATQKTIPFNEGFLTGLVLSNPRPISLQAIIHKGFYDAQACKIKDPLTKQLLTIKEAVERHIVDEKISEIKDVKEDCYVNLQEAFVRNLIDSDSGKLRNNKSKELVPINKALELKLIRTKPVVFNLLQAILANYYNPQTGLILNPITGEDITLLKAIEYKLIDPATTRIKDDRRGRIVELHDAIQRKLVDGEKGLLVNPLLTLDQAYLKGYILSTVLPWSLQETLAQNVYDPNTGKIIFNDSVVTIIEAIDGGIVNSNVLTVKDPQSGDIITLNDAIQSKLIDPVQGVAYDPVTKTEMNLVEAQERGLIVPYNTQITLPEAVFKGFYDPATGKFINPKNKERLKPSSAINRGYVDTSGTLVTIDEEIVTFDQAVTEGLIDTNKGVLMSYDEPVDFNEAFERGLFVEIRPPIPLSEAIAKGIYDEKSQLFLDPQTGHYLTLIEAIEISLIDVDSVSVKDTRVGIWRKIPLIDAIHNNYVDGNTGKVRDFAKGENYEVPLQKAFDLGILVDHRAAVSLQRAIHQGLYDDATGKILDPTIDRKVTLHEAMRNFNVNPLLPCYFDRKQGKLYTLGETCRMGIIDKLKGSFKDVTIDKPIKLSEALTRGLIVDIETANFGLYEALEMGLYVPEEGVFIQPTSGRKLTMKESIENELINPETSLVKNSKLNKYVTLTVALESKLIDDQLCVYVFPHGKTIDLLEARNKGLIVTSRTPLTLEEAIQNCLYRPESGKFADPVNGEFYSLKQALVNKFIDPQTTVFKDLTNNTTRSLPLAIEEGKIDVEKGRVLDPKSKKTYNFDEALKKGVLVTLDRPLEEVFVGDASTDSTASPSKQPRECALDESIKFELLDPEVAVIKDLQTGKFKTVNDAIKDGQLEITKTVIFDVKSSTVKSFVVTYDNTIVIYLKEPITFRQAIESKQLNVSTGKFTVPETNEEISLKDSITLGYIDPDSVLLKDANKKKLLKFPEGFRKGLIDADKGNVLDSATSKLHSLTSALDLGLVITPNVGFSLIETVTYGIYNPTTGCFTDPFVTTNIIDRRKLTLTEAIDENLVDPSSTVVKDLESGAIVPLLHGIETKVVDAVGGRLLDMPEKKEYDFSKALEKGLILAAEERQAVEEKYKLCDETLSKLLNWIGVVEDNIASQDVIHETEEQLRNQINTMKQIKDDLDQHSGQVSHCGDQVKQLVLTAGDILSKSEISALEKSGRNLKTRYDKAVDKTDKLLRRLFASRDELSKLIGELKVFSAWLGKARRVLEDKERALTDLQRLDSSADSTREFVSDVIAHQADLRFITMSAQKFVDEGKEYLNILNDFRTQLPSRLPHIEPLSSQDSPVRSEVSLVTQQYKDLLNRANSLSDRFSGVGGRQREYTDAVDRAKQWLREAEPRANKVLNEAIAGDPKTVEDQLHRAKALNNEFVSNGKLIDGAKHATAALVKSLEGQISPSEINRLESPVQDLEYKYNQLSGAIANRCQELDTALIQSQGVQDALDGLIDWLNQAENQFKNMQRPASLVQERLDEQLREHRVFQSDIDTHNSSIDSVYMSANELIVSTSNARVAKKIEEKLNDVKTRFDKLFDRVQNRGIFLGEVNKDLIAFNNQAAKFDKWYGEIMGIIDSRDLAKLPEEQYTLEMKKIARNREDNRALFEEVVGIGRELLNKRDVTDTANVRDRVKNMEGQWRDLELLLEEKTKLSKLRAEQRNSYETLKEEVLNWLSTMETKLARLDVVAVHLETIKQQNEELKPITSEYKNYSITIDKINDIGTAYDNMLKGDRPDSPARRKGYSPSKRISGRRPSQDGRSPSPTKGLSPLSPGGSSGFSSRRSSQDGFHLEELSPIQQQLSEINNKYSLLGVKINDRQSEIDSIREELKKQLDNLKTLSSFLDKIQRQLPKDAVPNTKDEADKLNKQIKQVLEEMYEKQSLLDTTSTQVKDLLKRKAGALGADNLHDELEDVLSHWKSLSDYLKNRIKFMEDMKEFHDTHDSLTSWLGAKERMLTVLGPISSDSRMVQSQVQQVQVLREEFRSQQPQLQHLIDVGDDVLSYLEPRSPDHQKINNKLATVQDKWADILSKLEERADSLGAAADTSREFDAQLIRLRDALQGISDNLDDVSYEKDPEEQLRRVENLERQLEGQRPLLADLEANGAQLCEVLSDPASRADIQGKLASVDRQYKALQKKLDLKKAEIEGSLRDGRQFEESCAKTLGWLSDELGSFSERLLISAIRDVLDQQLSQHEPIYRDILAREHEVIMLLNKGREMISRSTKGDTRSLQRELDKIQQSWDKLRKEAVDRQTRLKTCKEHCRKYYTALESFLPWLRQAEDKIDSLKLQSFEKKHIEKQLKEIQTFRNEIWKKSGEYENTKSLGDTFVSSCDIDKDVVKNELQELKERWEKLNNDLILRTQALEDQSRKLTDFNENMRDLKHGLERCEDKLASHDALGGASRDPKLLDRIKALREETSKLKKPLQNLRNQAGDLCQEASDVGIDANHLKDDVESIGDRIEDLQGKLDDRCSELQSAATAVTQFNDKVKILSQDLSGLESELDGMKAPARDVKTVRGQIDDVNKFLDKIRKASSDVEDAIQSGERLVDSGFAPDTAQTRQQVDTLKKQLGKLDDRAHSREKDLESTLKKLEDFYINHAEVLDGIGDASDQLRKLKPIGSDVEGIRAQQKDFKKFRANTIEPLNRNVDTCNRFGQGLIQSAAPGVNTQTLEKDLEKMNDQWNTLKEKINDRERKLDIALLQSGKFQEALDGLAKWLADTEDLVANQKPPSADYKVVKAQLQEQKFLKKMLLDRQNSMSSLFNMGNEIAKEAEPSERKAIEKQLKDLIGRFDALTENAQQRTLDLEQAMKVAKEFQDKLVPLQDWLERSEKKVRDMELIPTDEEKIQQRIREHDALHNDILEKKPDFRELTDIASNLMSLVGEDEAASLADKLQEVTDRYSNLVDASDNIGQLLTASRQGLRHLVLTYQDLAAWMDEMEQRLARYKVLAVHTERLLEQMDDLTALTEGIASRQSDVDGTVDSGVELMRHISSDEALQLKDKLDSLQRRYNDLTSRGSDLLKHAENLLPLVQKFHNNHNRLVEWMQGAEAILQSAEPNEGDIARLELDLQELRPVLESINVLGPQLCQASPGEGAATIEGLVTRDNRRFDAIAEQIQRRAERIHLGKQRALEVTGDIDELLEWFREVEGQIKDAEKPSADSDLIRVQLKEHKALNDDISSQKGRVRDVLSTAKKVLRESPPSEDTSFIREKMEDLREAMDTVSALSSDRLGILEQALPLAEHFHDTHIGLINWLSDMEEQVQMLSMPALRPDAIAQQQDRNEMFLQSINEHKPLIDKLNKTGEALVRLCNEDDGAKVQELLDSDNARYAALKLELRQRQQALEQALQESSQFSDKLEGMLRALTNTADQVNNQEPISAHVPKIRDQIEDNDAIISDLDKRKEAYAAVQRAADDVITKAGNRADPAVKDIKRKLDKLKNLWDDVQKATKDRGNSLENALDAAEKFWKELHAIMATLKDLEDSLVSQEPPAVEPKAIQEQQVALQEIRQEIDQTKPEVDQVRSSGQKLMKLCGEPDKPEVKKHIEDLDNAWDNITALYAKREENLIDAMEKAMEFHETLQDLLAFLDRAEKKFDKMGPLGSDIEAVKSQIDQLKNFKVEVDPHMVKVEALNRSLIRQAQELTERTSADQAAAIKEPLSAVNKRWDDLLRGMVERQRQLENALLRLGQFQHALNELLVWISKTDKTLDELKPVAGDAQVLEIELAKLKVLINDIQAHQTSVDTLNDAGRQLIESGKDRHEASATQEKLNTLNTQWRALVQKAADRQRELEDALSEAQRFNAEIQDLLSWLGDVDGIIAASKPVGGLPETASEQLERFMEIYNEIEENRPKVETVLAQGQEYLKKAPSNTASNLQHNLKTLKQRWDSVTARANDKKIKLEIALKEATEFHESLQAFVDWLTNAEKILTSLKPVSRVLDTVQQQIEEHKIFQKDVSAHREIMLALDKKGTHLKYFSQKQDVILIKNLLISVQHRWERVASKSAERTRALDLGYKEAKEFHDSWSGLMSWLDETEQNLDDLMADSGGNDPEKIKTRLNKHQEFQRALSAKQAIYDGIMKNGKHLKDKAPKTDETILKQMLTDLKNKWNAVCNKSVERQRKLEEALLYSGQYKDAIAALLAWLKKVQQELSQDSPVHGDLDTVNHLVELHRQFEKELEKRNDQMESVMRSGQELERTASKSDAANIRKQLTDLTELWESVTGLTHLKTDRLHDALKDAERLHRSVNMILDWLSDAEMKLRFVGNTPEDEASAYEQLKALDEFRAQLNEKEIEKDQTIELAHRILAKAHPDAINVIKNWIKVIQSRWEEVSQWALQRHQKLSTHMQSLRDLDESLEELIQWLLGLENTLIALKREELPMDIPATEQLIADHKEFMENTQKRQLEVDRVCKAKQVKPAQGPRDLKKFGKGKGPIRGSQHDLHEHSAEYGTLGRKQSFKGSRDLLSRGSRTSPGRELSPEYGYPHIGPRFPPSGSEPEFRSPRVKFLYDKWRHVWVLSWERQRELYDHLAYLKEKEKADNFSWDDWRKRFLKFMNYKKSRLTDLFRKMDKDNNELIPREDFIDGIIRTKFDTSRLEMKHVADMFDENNRGLIDWKKFIAALRPDWEEKSPDTDAQKIHDEVKRLVMLCTCRQKFRVFQVGEGKYRFGDSQKLRLVRILRSTVMVRVGGGWVALDEFLLKNDPCRAKGRTNIELREQFILADGVSQTMTAFKSKRSSASPVSGSSSSSLRTPQGPITKVRERSQRSVPMGSLPRNTKSSLSAGTPDSLSDNESGFRTPKRPPYRSALTPGGSRSNSRPASRTGSRPGSKPPSRHGSNLSLDSTDDTPSRIPRRTPTTSGRSSATLSSAKKTALNGTGSRPRTPSGLRSPASPAPRSTGISRASSIPTLSGISTSTSRSRIPIYKGPSKEEPESPSTSSSCSVSLSSGSTTSKSHIPVLKRSASSNKVRQVTICVGPTLRTASRTRTPSGSNTPVHPDQQTAVSRILRRPSGASDTPTGTRKKKSIEEREPFRL
ncbi:dystonin-like protein short stop isoform X46 [Rhynchophorus ferrugineus]|uniref:dystonin-like protein short stop isoform X46 n=1 Tax=Rhynchophorus ferrugineus TaxID=354439 RepID=UPI003FCEAA7B